MTVSTLVVRNFRHDTRRSSLKLERELWAELEALARFAGCAEAHLFQALVDVRGQAPDRLGDGTFTSLVRVFIIRGLRLRNAGWTHAAVDKTARARAFVADAFAA